ncbi:hypothetical protein J5W56_02220 [Candidatus Akkermansia timonensis]|nr:hypothetical protein [Candidatus Akkermansia timonensis]QWO93822.1 hypothetical protein J5W56_02220 [Candidatus Akkermansia timonensis]
MPRLIRITPPTIQSIPLSDNRALPSPAMPVKLKNVCAVLSAVTNSSGCVSIFQK